MRYLVGIMMVAFFVVGFGLFAGGLRELFRRLLRHRHFERAEGVVVSILTKQAPRTSRTPGSSWMHFPVIRFTPLGAATVTFTSELGDGGAVSRYAVGQKLAIRYDPRGEFPPMLDSWMGVWFPNLMLLLSGVLFVGGAGLIYWAFGDRIWGR